MKLFSLALLICAILLAPVSSGVAIADDTNSISSSVVGSNIPKTREMAQDVVKRTIYFIALLLVGVSVFKRVKKYPRRSVSDGPIFVEARHNLGPKAALLVVSIDAQRLLISQDDSGIKFLTELDSSGDFERAMVEAEVEINKPTLAVAGK